jgi:glycosyltransferase involved in cell wall biosynthesis
MKVSAYIPCRDNKEHIEAAILALQRQSYPLHELLVIDDGSKDGSAEVARQLGASIVQHSEALGRGAARARAFAEATGDLVVGLDATCTVAPHFIERTLHWFDSNDVAGVFGRTVGPEPQDVVERWRARHLFLEYEGQVLTHHASLITACSVLRRSTVVAVGNFSSLCRHSEDAELGDRLKVAGWDIIQDPSLEITAHKRDTLASVLERFWRWYAPPQPKASLHGWWKMLGYALKVMIRQDIQAGDPLAAGISFLLPHYQLLRSVREGRKS